MITVENSTDAFSFDTHGETMEKRIGTWKFNRVKNVEERSMKFYKSGFNSSHRSDIAFSSNCQMFGFIWVAAV